MITSDWICWLYCASATKPVKHFGPMSRQFDSHDPLVDKLSDEPRGD